LFLLVFTSTNHFVDIENIQLLSFEFSSLSLVIPS
jgi:hypothetical protein